MIIRPLFNIKNFSLVMILLFLCFYQTSLGQRKVFFSSDFEQNDGGLMGTGSWEWGLLYSGPDTAHSDFFCWGTNLRGSYSDSSIHYLELPEIDLSKTPSALLTFWHWYEFESDGGLILDGGNVKISRYGWPFKIITPFRDYDGIIDNQDNPINQEPVFGGLFSGKQWQKVTINLRGNSKIIIRFEMASDPTINYAGWYIDDIKVTENYKYDAALWSVNAPMNMLDFFLQPFTPEVTIFSAGSEIISYPVYVKIFHSQQEVYSSVRNVLGRYSGEKIIYQFDPWLPELEGIYRISAYTALESDSNSVNDTLEVENINVIKIPYSDVSALSRVNQDDSYGIAWGDYNNDGFIDMYTAGNQLLYNNGDRFFLANFQLPISPEDPGYGIWGDYDNDGDLDLFNHRSSFNVPGYLCRNEKNKFIDVSNIVGFSEFGNDRVRTATWLDADNDGLLDLYVVMNGTQNQFYHNRGDGTFDEIAEYAGIDISDNWNVTVFDYNNDRYSDIFLYGRKPIVLQNNGDLTFSDKSSEVGISNDRVYSMDFGDYDNDGFFDIYTTSSQDRLYRNLGNGTFEEIQLSEEISNLGSALDYSLGCCDYNNDGYIDILRKVKLHISPSGSVILRNDDGDGNFSVLPIQRFDELEENYGFAFADYDEDGDLDFYSRNRLLYRNNENKNNWLRVQLHGTSSNSEGIGAHVRIVINSVSQIREIVSGSAGRQSSRIVHFGVGKSMLIDSLIVQWPSSIMDISTNIQPNQKIIIEEGTGIVDVNPMVSFETPTDFNLISNYPNPFCLDTEIMYKVSKKERTIINIYNSLGQKVRKLVDSEKQPGTYLKNWNGTDHFGNQLSNGVYFVNLRNGSNIVKHKVILLR